MSEFIRCPSCGFCFAPYKEFFSSARQAIYADVIGTSELYKKYDKEKLALNPHVLPPLEGVLNALGIRKICCRTRVLTEMRIDEMY